MHFAFSRAMIAAMKKKRPIHKALELRARGMHRSVSSRLRAYFIAGILITAPISITVYLTLVFLNFVDNTVIHILPAVWYHGLYGKTTIPGLGLIVAIAFFILIGWLTTNILGRFFVRVSEYLVHRMPVIRTLYGTIKQIFHTIMASKSQAFRNAVMLEYPRKGIWSIGFVTGKTEGEVQRVTAEETINVFVPTTPNPTSGYLLFVPKKELIYLDMSVEEAVKLVVSAGIITPPDREIEGKKPKDSNSKETKPKSQKAKKEKKS